MNLVKAAQYCFAGRSQRIVFAQLAFFLLLCGLAASLWSTLRSQIEDQDVYRVSPSDINVWNPPEWLPKNFVEATLEYLPPDARGETFNALDPNLTGNLLRAFTDSPWVDKVESIVVSYPRRIDVTLKFRAPIAYVDASQASFQERLDEFARLFADDEFIKTLRFQSSLNAPANDRTPERKLVDSFGRYFNDEYFRKRPEARDAFPTIATYGSYGEYVPKAAEFADFLRAFNAIGERKIETIHVFKALGEKEPVFFLTTKDGRTVKWGAFDAPSAGAKSAFEGVGERRTEEELKTERWNSQKKKLDAWNDAPVLDLSKIQ